MTAHSSTPGWLDRSLYPFTDHFIQIEGNQIHYVDEGNGPVLLLLHGNPTWSFLYRHIIAGLSSRYRCIAPDYPGFGLSIAQKDYRFLPQEHAHLIEQFIIRLQLTDIRLMVQDWGGPIGLGVAGRRPDLFHSLLIGNTWAWPAQGSQGLALFSRIVGSAVSGFIIQQFNAFVTVILPSGISRKLTPAERAAYAGPFPTWSSRWPTALFPREILRGKTYLAQVEANLSRLVDKPVLLLWGDQDAGFREEERLRFEALFPRHRTRVLKGAKHYIQEDAPNEICQEITAFENTFGGPFNAN